MGRNKANIDWNKVDRYLQAQCDATGIAGLMGICRDTLYNRCKEDNNIDFSTYSQQKKSEGRELLRGKQFETAMKGDKTMLVWLGKQYLGQKDRHEGLESERPPSDPPPINIIIQTGEVKKED